MRTSANTISVILPVCNGEKFIEQCITSIVNQSVAAHQIIIVNDGSTDNSRHIINRFKNIQYIQTENRGVAAARNEGIAKSTGAWIAFIDQDDFWTPHSLRDRLQVMQTLSKPEIVVGKQKWFLDDLDEIPEWVKKDHVDVPLDGYLLGCALIHRDLFKKIGLFDTSFRFSSDYDWFFRIRDSGVIFYATDEVVLHKRIHPMNESRHAALVLKELMRATFESIKRKRAGH